MRITDLIVPNPAYPQPYQRQHVWISCRVGVVREVSLHPFHPLVLDFDNKLFYLNGRCHLVVLSYLKLSETYPIPNDFHYFHLVIHI